jgi:hypothetical protein
MNTPSGLPSQHDFAFNASIIDSAAGTTYTCYAAPGSLSTDAVWSISKTVVVGGLTTVTWANGNSKAINIAANRAILIYS